MRRLKPFACTANGCSEIPYSLSESGEGRLSGERLRGRPEKDRCETENGALLERYVYHGITAGRCLVHGEGNALKIQPHNPPCRVPEYNNGYFSAHQVLLIPDTFAGREQNVEPRGLSYS